ncbi:MAG: type II toxin-antitoxin system RelE/ParE family toxin [Alphaproteobacteria bacterium]|nr:type II toxin-antitoxin system RelE/ParE family toxin [Alphaproteobacteria bacterium]
MKVSYSDMAIGQLDNIFQYISQERPNIAKKVYTEIVNAANGLSRNYKLYRLIGDNIRLMPVYKGKFRVLYDVDEVNQEVHIQIIQHHSQDMTQHIS